MAGGQFVQHFLDFQAPGRANHPPPLSGGTGARPEYVHTLNGSGLALATHDDRRDGELPAGGRIHCRAGSAAPYMGGMERIA